MPRPSDLLAILYTAASEPLGLWITTPDPVALKSALYLARRGSGDPSLAALSIRTPPNNTTGAIWIVRGADPGTAPLPSDTSFEEE